MIVTYGSALIIEIVAWVLLLKLGARWAKVAGVTAARALLVLLTSAAIQLLVAIPLRFMEPIEWSIAAIAVCVAVAVVVPVMTIVIHFQAPWLRAMLAWLPTLLAPAFALALLFLVVRPFLIASFEIPQNSMAPTILGNHFTVTCSTCGGPAYGSTPSGDFPMKLPVICEHFHVHKAMPSTATSEGDRIMVAKYLCPRRWDIVAFRLPENPSVVYLKRLVGLPGETVTIKDGAVWISGQRLDPPPSLKELNYVTDLPMLPRMRLAGTPQNPAVLGPGEYFVLGDFSSFSSDSRLWQNGAPGHPHYAVPASYIIGVATHIYWPPSRWRILR
jgi:signal peptidase I